MAESDDETPTGNTPTPIERPRPGASPRPPRPSLDEPVTSPNLKAQRYDAARRRRPWWAGAVTALVTGIGATWQHVETRSAELQREREERKADVAHLEHGQSETRTDIRALYQSVIEGRPSPRLEQPVLTPARDGGP